MNEVQLHELYVCEHLDDKLAAHTLVDHHRDVSGMTHRESLRAVAELRKRTRDAYFMGYATGLLAEGSPCRGVMGWFIRQHIPLVYRHQGYILVVPGWRMPRAHPPGGQHGDSVPYTFCISVGARRVAMFHNQLLVEAEKAARRVARRRFIHALWTKPQDTR